jgi:hypothetical protein
MEELESFKKVERLTAEAFRAYQERLDKPNSVKARLQARAALDALSQALLEYSKYSQEQG